MKGKLILSIFIIILVNLSIFCADEEINNFQKGNFYYEQDNFDKAIEEYNSIINKGLESGNLYYNLGNCYFKKGDLGRAILNYEKAYRLIPWDKDLESNYEYAYSLVKGNIYYKNNFIYRIFDKFTIDGLTILLTVLYIFSLIIVLIGFILKSAKKICFAFIGFLLIVFILGFVSLFNKINNLHKEGIILVKETEVKFEPKESSTTYFTIYEGTKVKIIYFQNEWVKIKRADNKIGWIKRSHLEVI
ncbi:MAG: tetratricopeptide repeat protein [Candidatus Omnitrophica bacterium]|nr:tetratricopeptide repeat protein [Candidatus Omnitrophota bacterium]MCM8826299.1 tetratricopeptide repeat protein [Candidatus Omnitrophota bacterium]